MRSERPFWRHLGCKHRGSVIGEVITPVVIFFLRDPAMYVFLFHGVPVIQVLPEIGSRLRDELVQMQTGDIIDAIDSKAINVLQGKKAGQRQRHPP